MKPPLGCTNRSLWVALARMLDESASPLVSESEVNRCRAWLLSQFLRNELDCKEPGCSGTHDREAEIMLTISKMGAYFLAEIYAEIDASTETVH